MRQETIELAESMRKKYAPENLRAFDRAVRRAEKHAASMQRTSLRGVDTLIIEDAPQPVTEDLIHRMYAQDPVIRAQLLVSKLIAK